MPHCITCSHGGLLCTAVRYSRSQIFDATLLVQFFPFSTGNMHTLLSVSLSLSFIWICYSVVTKYIEYRSDLAYGRKHNCAPQPQLYNRWPLGIDWLRALWQSDSQQRLLAFLCRIADDYEPRNNLSQYFLFGPRAHHILHPRNVETVLSLRFQGIGPSSHHPVSTD